MVEFGSKEDAIIYCERMGSYYSRFIVKLLTILYRPCLGYKYEVVEPPSRPQIKKTYGANFSWNKKTRVATK